MKKTNLRVISCLTAVMLVMASVMIAPIEISAETASPSIKANGTCGDNLTWTLDNGTLTISGTGDMQDYDYETPWQNYRDKIIEVQIKNGVTSIGDYAFFGCNLLTTITFPDSVTRIGYAAFSCCIALESVTIPDGVKSIGEQAFGSCHALESITLPASVTYIGRWAFIANYRLKNIYVDENNPEYISVDGVLYTKDKTCLVCHPAKRKEIQILDGVTSIAPGAFAYFGVGSDVRTSITLPDSVMSIGENAFDCCYGITGITIPDGVTRIEDSAFWNCVSLESITIPDSVTSIGDSVFHNCQALESVTIPDSVTSIGKCAFSHCTALTSITIPDSVTSIGSRAFENCGALETITIPESVKNIGEGAFDGCHKLTIYGASGSYAQKYAKENNIPFMPGVFVGDRFFLDVKPGAWYLGAIEYALDNGLFYGVSPKMFAPDEPMTRAMLVTVLWRMEEEPAVSGENPFIDVPSGGWYTDAVKWAAENDIVKGIEKDKYDPMADITREQAAAILYRYSQYKEYDVEKSADLAAFPDGNDTSDYAVTELSWAYAEGLITGVKKGNTDYLEPQGSATRAQVASILMRYKKNLAK